MAKPGLAESQEAHPTPQQPRLGQAAALWGTGGGKDAALGALAPVPCPRPKQQQAQPAAGMEPSSGTQPAATNSGQQQQQREAAAAEELARDAAAPPRRARGRPPLPDAQHSRAYTYLKQRREKKKSEFERMCAEVEAKVAQVKLLAADNAALRAREQGLAAVLAHSARKMAELSGSGGGATASSAGGAPSGFGAACYAGGGPAADGNGAAAAAAAAASGLAGPGSPPLSVPEPPPPAEAPPAGTPEFDRYWRERTARFMRRYRALLAANAPRLRPCGTLEKLRRGDPRLAEHEDLVREAHRIPNEMAYEIMVTNHETGEREAPPPDMNTRAARTLRLTPQQQSSLLSAWRTFQAAVASLTEERAALRARLTELQVHLEGVGPSARAGAGDGGGSGASASGRAPVEAAKERGAGPVAGANGLCSSGGAANGGCGGASGASGGVGGFAWDAAGAEAAGLRASSMSTSSSDGGLGSLPLGAGGSVGLSGCSGDAPMAAPACAAPSGGARSGGGGGGGSGGGAAALETGAREMGVSGQLHSSELEEVLLDLQENMRREDEEWTVMSVAAMTLLREDQMAAVELACWPYVMSFTQVCGAYFRDVAKLDPAGAPADLPAPRQ